MNVCMKREREREREREGEKPGAVSGLKKQGKHDTMCRRVIPSGASKTLDEEIRLW